MNQVHYYNEGLNRKTRKGISGSNTFKALYQAKEASFNYMVHAHAVGALVCKRIRDLMITKADKLAKQTGRCMYVNNLISRSAKFGSVLQGAHRHGLADAQILAEAHLVRIMQLVFSKEDVLKYMIPKPGMERPSYERDAVDLKHPLEFYRKNYYFNPERPFEPKYVLVGEHQHSQGMHKTEELVEILKKEFPKSVIIFVVSDEKNAACTLGSDIGRAVDGVIYTGEKNKPYAGILMMDIVNWFETTYGKPTGEFEDE